MKTLVSIVGPTASGKTALAVALAKRFGTVVLSADSRQIFRELNIGTAKPTAEEMQGVPHYFMDMVSPEEHISSGIFGEKVRDLLVELFNKHEVVILAGGSGFYFGAVWEGMNEIPDVPEEIREAVNSDLREKGLPFLLQELQSVDPALYEKIDRNNPRRVTRAIEVFRSTGIPLSQFHQPPVEVKKDYRDLKIGIAPAKEDLHDAINRRVDEMMQKGLLAEVKNLVTKYGSGLQAFATVGYSEIIRHLIGEMSLEEAVELIKKNTRRYAKRQLTWFRRYEDIHWFSPGNFPAIVKAVEDAVGN